MPLEKKIKHGNRSQKKKRSTYLKCRTKRKTWWLNTVWLFPHSVVSAAPMGLYVLYLYFAPHCVLSFYRERGSRRDHAISWRSYLAWKHLVRERVRSQEDKLIQAGREANKSTTAQCNGMCWRDQNKVLTVCTPSPKLQFLFWHVCENLDWNSFKPSCIVSRRKLVKEPVMWSLLAHTVLPCGSRWTSSECSAVSQHEDDDDEPQLLLKPALLAKSVPCLFLVSTLFCIFPAVPWTKVDWGCSWWWFLIIDWSVKYFLEVNKTVNYPEHIYIYAHTTFILKKLYHYTAYQNCCQIMVSLIPYERLLTLTIT